MRIFKNHSKKMMKSFCILITAILSIFIVSPSLRADISGSANAALEAIRKNTYDSLQVVNTLPAYALKMIEFFKAWLDEDTSTLSAKQGTSFMKLQAANDTYDASVLALQPRLLKDFFGTTPLNFANDLTYQTLLNRPYLNPDPRLIPDPKTGQKPDIDPAYNYIKNASGLGISHLLLQGNEPGSATSQRKYAEYYRTVSAVQTYNGYLLSKSYAQFSGGNSLSQAQKDLVALASDQAWLTGIGGEKIGYVLRQILMFNSQIYVLLVRLLDTQQQLLTTQAMTNTLLMLLNQSNEDILYKKAIGKVPE